MEATEITFDLETLGNTYNAPIVQIGAVKFDINGKIHNEFIRNIRLESLEKYPFTMDYSTVNWWLNQDNSAIQSVFGEHLKRVNIKEALYDFHQWIEKQADYNYWSHATFDPPILNNNYQRVGMESHIPFRKHNDIRTLTRIAGSFEVERVGIHHNALDDCLYQAAYITKGLQIIKAEE